MPGAAPPGHWTPSTTPTWESDLQLKVMGAVRLTRAALPHLRQSRGAAVFTLAMAAKAPGARQHPDCGRPGPPAWP